MTSAQPQRAASFEPASGLRALGGFVAFGLGVSTLYALTGIGFPCPFRTITGWECPLCGGTRLGAALLEFHPVQAFADNPLVFLGLSLLPLLAVAWTIELLGGPKLGPPARLRSRLGAIRPTQWLVAFLVLGVLYTLARNLL